MTASPLLQVQSLTKAFGGLRALDGIDINVFPGEIVGLVGPNGAGKTALINTITGFYRATSGAIHFKGTDITALPLQQIGRIGISRTFQNIRLFKRMTVLENAMTAYKPFVAHPLRSLVSFAGQRRAKEQAMQWLTLLQLANKPNQLASSLSYGDARRLEIARALVGTPDLLLLDEPAAGMNDAETSRLAEDILAVRKHVQAILLIEHDMTLIRHLSDRLIAMDYGRKIAEGKPSEVLSHPEVLKAYLGSDTNEAPT